MKILEKAGWIIVVLLVFVGVTSVIGRAVTMTQILLDPSFVEPDPTSFDGRYNAHPVLTLFHVIPGVLFMVLGPLQFVRKIRSSWIQVHRWSGRVYLLSSVVLGVAALSLTFIFPVFGSFTATVAIVFFGSLFLFSILRAYLLIRRRQVRLHREWMIRGFALGLGISTFRVFQGIFMGLAGASLLEAWDTVVWFGFALNLAVAETWINLTRQPEVVQMWRSVAQESHA